MDPVSKQLQVVTIGPDKIKREGEWLVEEAIADFSQCVVVFKFGQLFQILFSSVRGGEGCDLPLKKGTVDVHTYTCTTIMKFHHSLKIPRKKEKQ